MCDAWVSKGSKRIQAMCVEPGNGKLIISLDVIFKEQEMPFLKETTESTQVEVEVSEQPIEEHLERISDDVIRSQDTQSGETSTRELDQPRVPREKSKRNKRLLAKYSDYDVLYYASLWLRRLSIMSHPTTKRL